MEIDSFDRYFGLFWNVFKEVEWWCRDISAELSSVRCVSTSSQLGQIGAARWGEGARKRWALGSLQRWRPAEKKLPANLVAKSCVLSKSWNQREILLSIWLMNIVNLISFSFYFTLWLFKMVNPGKIIILLISLLGVKSSGATQLDYVSHSKLDGSHL